MAKNIFIAATAKDVGKSTISFALIDHLLKNGQKVGFMKPVGQRWLPSEWGEVEEDVILMKDIFKFKETPPQMNPIVIKRGFTEEYISKIVKPDLESKIIDGYQKVSEDKDFVIIEGTGHAGVGAVIDKSNADVAKILRAKVVLLAKGGIGSAIDKLELNRIYFEKKGVEVIGIILNKVLISKLEKVKRNIIKYCKKNNLKFYGAIPYSPILSNPTLGQIIDELKPKVYNEAGNKYTVIDRFMVGASHIDEFINFFQEKKGNMLMVIPSVRLDIIFSIPNLKKFTSLKDKKIFTILFTGKNEPSKVALKSLEGENINVLWKKGDTYSVVSQLSSISIKTRPDDEFKINEIRKIVINNIDHKKMLSKLSDSTIQKSERLLLKLFNFFRKK